MERKIDKWIKQGYNTSVVYMLGMVHDTFFRISCFCFCYHHESGETPAAGAFLLS